MLDLTKFLLLIVPFHNNTIFDEFACTSLCAISFFVIFCLICSNVVHICPTLQVNFMLQESEN